MYTVYTIPTFLITVKGTSKDFIYVSPHKLIPTHLASLGLKSRITYLQGFSYWKHEQSAWPEPTPWLYRTPEPLRRELGRAPSPALPHGTREPQGQRTRPRGGARRGGNRARPAVPGPRRVLLPAGQRGAVSAARASGAPVQAARERETRSPCQGRPRRCHPG